MANKKKYTVSIAGPNDPIFRQGFKIYRASSTKEFIHQREQKENLKNEFLERIDTKKDRQSIKRNLINILQKNGWVLR